MWICVHVYMCPCCTCVYVYNRIYVYVYIGCLLAVCWLFVGCLLALFNVSITPTVGLEPTTTRLRALRSTD